MRELRRLWWDRLSPAERKACSADVATGMLNSLAPSLLSLMRAATMDGERTWERIIAVAKRCIEDAESKAAAEGPRRPAFAGSVEQPSNPPSAWGLSCARRRRRVNSRRTRPRLTRSRTSNTTRCPLPPSMPVLACLPVPRLVSPLLRRRTLAVPTRLASAPVPRLVSPVLRHRSTTTSALRRGQPSTFDNVRTDAYDHGVQSDRPVPLSRPASRPVGPVQFVGACSDFPVIGALLTIYYQ